MEGEPAREKVCGGHGLQKLSSSLKYVFGSHLGDLYKESGQTSQCSFSSVSTPPIARVGAFFSIFRDLQDVHSFVPLRIQNLSKNLLHFCRIFTEILQTFRQNLLNFNEISPEFHKICSDFAEMKNRRPSCGERCRKAADSGKIQKLRDFQRSQYDSLLASNCARPAAAFRDHGKEALYRRGSRQCAWLPTSVGNADS